MMRAALFLWGKEGEGRKEKSLACGGQGMIP